MENNLLPIITALLCQGQNLSDASIDQAIMFSGVILQRCALQAGDPSARECQALREEIRALKDGNAILKQTADTQARRLAAYSNLASAGVSNDR